MNRIWERSRNKGSALLLLLAIADHAHDDGGGAYPSIRTLARKTRMSERATQMLLQKLIESGELSVRVGAGPRGANLYRVNLEALRGEKFAGVPGLKTAPKGVKSLRGEKIAPVQSFQEGGEKSGAEGVKHVAPEPSNKDGTVIANHQQQQTPANDLAAATANGQGKYADEAHDSRFTYEQIAAYCRAAKPWASNPGGLARVLYRTGQEDTEIAEWMEARARRRGDGATGRRGDGETARPERSGAWGAALDEIERRIGEAATITWFEPLIFDPEANALIAPDPVFVDWINNNYREALDAGLERAGLGHLEINTANQT